MRLFEYVRELAENSKDFIFICECGKDGSVYPDRIYSFADYIPGRCLTEKILGEKKIVKSLYVFVEWDNTEEEKGEFSQDDFTFKYDYSDELVEENVKIVDMGLDSYFVFNGRKVFICTDTILIDEIPDKFVVKTFEDVYDYAFYDGDNLYFVMLQPYGEACDIYKLNK